MEIDLFGAIHDFNDAQDLFTIESSEDLSAAADVCETMGYFSFKNVFVEWDKIFDDHIEAEFDDTCLTEIIE